MLQIGAALFYYKLRETLLQIGAGSLLKIGVSVVTNWGSYYKLGQSLLQNRAAITNWGKIYYKLGQALQIRAIITNWDITLFCITTGFVKKYYIVAAVLMVTHLTLFIVGIITQLNTNVIKPLAVLLIS